jgi:hypothetical protein
MNTRPLTPGGLLPALLLAAALPLSAQQTAIGRKTATVDPCLITSADTLKMLLGMGLKPHFPLAIHKDEHHITLSNPVVTKATCPNLGVEIHADIRYQDTRGLLQYSSTGTVRFRSPLQGVVVYTAYPLKAAANAPPITPTSLGSARACLTDITILELNLKNIPNWLDNTYMRKRMNEKLKDKACFDITELVRLYLTMGGTIPVPQRPVIERRKP